MAAGIGDVVLATVIASSTGTGIAMAIGGIIAVIALSAVFYAVGRGEDREREQAAADRAAATEGEAQPQQPGPADEPHPRPPPRRPRRRH